MISMAKKKKEIMTEVIDDKEEDSIIDDTEVEEDNDDLTSLFEGENENSEKYKILEELIDTSKNIAVKTIIEKPILYSSLKILTDVALQYKLPITSNILFCLSQYSLEFNISKDGIGREQIIKAISNINDDFHERASKFGEAEGDVN
jgi:hypothetical protein